MKKKTIVGLIVMVAIASVVIFAGCVEKGEVTPSTSTPTSTPASTPPKVLGSDDFKCWMWIPKVEPEAPLWPEVVLPPEDLTLNFYDACFAGDMDDITSDDEWKTDCYSWPTCTKISYSAKASEGRGWAGKLCVDVMYPKYSVGIDLRGVSKLTLWAKGEKGGEKVEFRVGCTKAIHPQPAISTGIITLKDSWQQYSIDLRDKDRLDHVFCGFSWITSVTIAKF